MSLTLGEIVELSPGERFKVERMLGSGGFGNVFLVTRSEHHVETPEEFALKVIECVDKSAITKALKEAQTLSKVKHDNIVRLYNNGDCINEETNNSLVFILTEYCSGGDLNFRLTQNSLPSQKLKWFYQLTSAIAYLHSQRPMIVHRDLKPANVLLTASDDIKVADFGLARQYEALKQLNLNSSASLHSYYMNSEVGTKAYIAPEVMNNHYTEKTDIFSLGILFYAILEETFLLLPNSDRIYGAFVNPGLKTPIGVAMYYKDNSSPREELDFPSTYKYYKGETAERLVEIVRGCLINTSEERPNASDICEHLNIICEEGESNCVLGNKNEAVQQNAYEHGDDIVNSGSEDDFNSKFSSEAHTVSQFQTTLNVLKSTRTVRMPINSGAKQEFDSNDFSCKAHNSEPVPKRVESELDRNSPCISINAGSDFDGDLDCEESQPT